MTTRGGRGAETKLRFIQSDDRTDSLLDADMISDLGAFASARSQNDLDRVLLGEIKVEVDAMLHAIGQCDAFDLIELMRVRELPISPELSLSSDYDGSMAVIELVSLVLLTRGSRFPDASSVKSTEPWKVVDELHQRAKRLIRLGTFHTIATARADGNTSLPRLASEYQSYFATVRGMRYESIESSHDELLLESAGISELLSRHMGFTYSEFCTVRDAVGELQAARLTKARDDSADVIIRCQNEGREPSDEERETVSQAFASMMFTPGSRATFTANDIADICNLGVEKSTAILGSFSSEFVPDCQPHELVRSFLRGQNPFNRKPLIRDGDHFIATRVEVGSDALRAIVEDAIKSSSKDWSRYNRHRKQVTERLAVELVGKLVDAEPSFRGFEYLTAKKGVDEAVLTSTCQELTELTDQTEADALFVVGDVAICVEVKGRSIPDQAKRGDRRRLEREVQTILGDAASQARRLEGLITKNAGVWRADRTWVDLGHVREVRSIVVGLDDFGPLTVTLGDLRRSNLLGDGSLPWITSLHDLDVISRVLERPSEFLLYLRRRSDSGVADRYRACDELDLFMLFLKGGLYVEPSPEAVKLRFPSAPPVKQRDRRTHEYDDVPTVVGTHTDELDAWIYWSEGKSAVQAAKPGFNAHTSALAAVDFLADGKKPGWFRFGADLLGVAGTAQRKFGSALSDVVRATRVDHLPHTAAAGFAGDWGYPIYFIGSQPDGMPIDEAAERLRLYMSAKKHQVGSDRCLGLVVNEQRKFTYVIYMNDRPSDNSELALLGKEMGLAPVGDESRPIPPSASRTTRRLRGKRRK